jgi:hypothetical protein
MVVLPAPLKAATVQVATRDAGRFEVESAPISQDAVAIRLADVDPVGVADQVTVEIHLPCDLGYFWTTRCHGVPPLAFP